LTERRYVVLDLFVFHAITSNDVDLFSKTTTVLRLIKDKCHIILLTRTLRNEYWRRIKEIERSRGGAYSSILLRFIISLLTNRDKVDDVEESPRELPREVVPENDLPLVRAALSKPAVNIVVITTDRRHLVDNEKLKMYLRRENPGIEIIHLDDYSKLDP
jgi:hypothetical protein